MRLTTKIRDGAGDRASWPPSCGHAMLRTAIQMPGFTDVMQAMQWIIVVLLLGAYSAAWMIDTTISSANNAWLAMPHLCAGITILLLIGVRLTFGRHTRVPPSPVGFSAARRSAAQANAGLLYLLLILQTLLGLLERMLCGHRMVLFGAASLPLVQLVDRMFARQVLWRHEVTGLLLRVLIGLRVAAALYHHVVRKGEVLVGILPGMAWQPRPGMLSDGRQQP